MKFDRITVDSNQMGGTPCIRGLRIPVATVVGMVADKMSQEEILEALDSIVIEEKLVGIIESIRTEASDVITTVILENYVDNMSPAKKMILGEKLARAVMAISQPKIESLVFELIKKSFELVDELRNEIIGEVFEETE